MATVVAVVGIMVTRQVVVEQGTPEDMQREIVAALTDERGAWKLDEFRVGEASIKVAVVDTAMRKLGPAAAGLVAMLPMCTVFALERLGTF